MEWIEYIEIVIVVISVIGLVYSGIFIGRRFGSMEDFILTLMKVDIERRTVFTKNGNMRVYKGSKLLHEFDLSDYGDGDTLNIKDVTTEPSNN